MLSKAGRNDRVLEDLSRANARVKVDLALKERRWTGSELQHGA